MINTRTRGGVNLFCPLQCLLSQTDNHEVSQHIFALIIFSFLTEGSTEGRKFNVRNCEHIYFHGNY